MPDSTPATAALRDWPCTNADHHGLCSADHVHADHVVTGIMSDSATGGSRD